MTRLVAVVLAYIFLALALVGIPLPGLPTVPFLLLSAWFAARGSPKLHAWLYAHPRFGKLLIDWETERAISRKSKILAVLMLIASWLIMFYKVNSFWVLALLGALFVVVGTYLISRPEPKSGE